MPSFFDISFQCSDFNTVLASAESLAASYALHAIGTEGDPLCAISVFGTVKEVAEIDRDTFAMRMSQFGAERVTVSDIMEAHI